MIGYRLSSVGPTIWGFIRSEGGNTTHVLDPTAWVSTFLFGVNDSGQIVGRSDFRGFLYEGSTFTTIDHPLADGTTTPQGINNGGEIVGYYEDSFGVTHGFLYNGGNYTTLDNPLATAGTYLTGINNTGQIVGYYDDTSGRHGFLYNAGDFITLDNALGAGGTSLTGINDLGEIVGNYIDSASNSQGFFGELAFSAEDAATIVYTEQYGVAPDPMQLDKLFQFTTPQYAYGQQIGVMDPAIYAYEALGMALAASATQFPSEWGSTNPLYPNSASGDAQFVTDVYSDVFGHPGSMAQVQHFINQLSYFENLYTSAGVFGSAENVDLLARGAIYGQMLGFEAALDPFGM